MRSRFLSLIVVLMLSLGPCSTALVTCDTDACERTEDAGSHPDDSHPGEFRSHPLSSIEGHFTENLGQKGEGAGLFYCRGTDLSVAFGPGWIAYDYRPRDVDSGALVRVSFDGSHDVRPIGEDPLPHVSNYFIGNEPDKWVMGAMNFREVIYPSLYDGIDLRFRLDEGQLKYDFLLEPGADHSEIRMVYHGADNLHVDEVSGDLLVGTATGTLRDMAPASFQEGPDGRRDVPSSFRRSGENVVMFDVTGHDPTLALVIDPGLEFSTYMGGTSDEVDESILVSVEEDSKGNVYVGTTTLSSDFPTTTGAYCTTYQPGNLDLVIFKLSNDGSKLDFATFIGGRGSEVSVGTYLAPGEDLLIFGRTVSTDFPTTSGAYQTRLGGSGDCFLLRLDSTGSALDFSTYFGGSGLDEYIYDADLDPVGNIYVTGRSSSTNLPTNAGCYDNTHNGLTDIFIAKLDKNASKVLYCTYVGGSSSDVADEIEVMNDSVHVMGWTGSNNLPATAGAFCNAFQGGASDGFVLRMDMNLSKLVFLTYIGGSAGEAVYPGLSFDSSGNLCFAGRTSSNDFPVTAGVYDGTFNGVEDGYIAKMDPEGTRLVFSTFIGGSAKDRIISMAMGDEGSIFFSGTTSSADMPVTDNAYDWTHNGDEDVCVGRLSSDGKDLEYCTFLGGTGADSGAFDGIVRGASNTTVVGSTESNNFPTTSGAYMETASGMRDIFVTRLETELPTGTLPSAPVNITVDNRTTSVYLGWEEPSDTGGLRISGYNIYRGNTSSDLEMVNTVGPATNPGYLDKDLVNARTYYFAVTALNLVGEGPRTQVVEATPFGLPGVPGAFLATPGCATVLLTWEEPPSGGYPILGYRVHRGESFFAIGHLLDLGNVTRYLDEGLENGRAYYYQVQALTEVGIGKNTTEVVVQPVGYPTEPLGLTAEPGDGFVLLNWEAPHDDGGWQLVGYRVFRGMSESALSKVGTVGGASTSYNDTNVLNGETYWYSVMAHTAAADGPRCRCISATPLGPPSTPLDLTVIPGDGEAMLSWKAPEDDGGTEVVGYHVFRGEGRDDIEWLTSVDVGTRSFEDTGLVNGQTYYYAVLAFNTEGSGPLTSAVGVVPVTLPDPPGEPMATVGNGSVSLTWLEPTKDGGADITGYMVLRGTSADSLEELRAIDGTLPTFEDTDVVAGTTYYYAVAAITSGGVGPMSPLVSATPYGPPGQPLDLVAIPGDGEVLLSWEAPDFDGASKITGYVVLRGGSHDDLWEVASLGDVYTYRDIGVINLRTYHYAVQAINKAGRGSVSAISEVAPFKPDTTPGKVCTLMAEADGVKVTVTWTAPENDGGSPVTGYVVMRGESPDDMEEVANLSLATTWTDKGLERGKIYYYTVCALNDVGQGEPFTALWVKVPKEAQEEPGFMAMTLIAAMIIAIPLVLLRRRHVSQTS